MKHFPVVVVLAASLCGVARGAQIQAIKVSGETSAEVSFLADAPLPATPRLVVEDNRIELTFADTGLSQTLLSQVDIPSPHALIQRISAFPADGGGARVRLIVNGSTEKLRDRVKLQKKDGSGAHVLNFPTGNQATIRLLREEQASLDTNKPAVAEARGGFGWFRLLMILVLFAGVGAGTWYVLKFAKKKTGWGGTRRHLIESVAQAPVGDGKASVAILRVGAEFVMVGITPNQVSLLSTLPKLQAQYEEESSLERDSFKEAIAQAARKGSGLGLEA
jgi:flagellar biogenesis protein FliO